MAANTSTRLGRDVSGYVPDRRAVSGYLELTQREAAIWELARPYLHVRNNDGHTLYAYGIAHALCEIIPEADRDIALPAILLHDVGWSTVPDSEILEAIAPPDGRHELVLQHEREGARIARDILSGFADLAGRVDDIAAIIDGHDTRSEPLSQEDAIVKDSDKIWRLTPHGLRTVMGWFDLSYDEALRLCCARVLGSLFTAEGRAMAAALAAVASLDLSPQGTALSNPISGKP